MYQVPSTMYDVPSRDEKLLGRNSGKKNWGIDQTKCVWEFRVWGQFCLPSDSITHSRPKLFRMDFVRFARWHSGPEAAFSRGDACIQKIPTKPGATTVQTSKRNVMKNFCAVPLIKTLLRQFGIALVLFLCSCTKDDGQTPPANVDSPLALPSIYASAAAVVDSMGTGFNLGNTFDLGLQNTNPASIYPIIDLYANAGMQHIRIPVTWMDGFAGNTLADANGNINFSHPRFIQLKTVIDYAISKGLFVVLNAHHERWLYRDYKGAGQYDNAFSNLWKGIATHFRDYPHLLIFEVLNEPHGVFGDWSGGASPTSSAALALTRQINKTGYDAIRSTGGLNASRVVMVSVNGMGNHNQLDDVYPSRPVLPGGGSDRYLALHVHNYDPWAFCGQTGSNAAYPGSEAIASPMRSTSNHAKTLNVPLNFGEFGVGRDANPSERDSDIVREYYRTMRLTCLSEKMAPTVWDDRGWFGLIDSNGSRFLFDIVPSMMAP